MSQEYDTPPPVPQVPPLVYQPPPPNAPPYAPYPPASPKSGKGLATTSVTLALLAIIGVPIYFLTMASRSPMFWILFLLGLGIHITGLILGIIGTARGSSGSGIFGSIGNAIVLLIILALAFIAPYA